MDIHKYNVRLIVYWTPGRRSYLGDNGRVTENQSVQEQTRTGIGKLGTHVDVAVAKHTTGMINIPTICKNNETCVGISSMIIRQLENRFLYQNNWPTPACCRIDHDDSIIVIIREPSRSG